LFAAYANANTSTAAAIVSASAVKNCMHTFLGTKQIGDASQQTTFQGRPALISGLVPRLNTVGALITHPF